MNQIIIGKFIAYKRRERNLTQEQLGEKLGVSHKSVSKWETGKCMPDYSVIEPLCRELEISISELLDGEENEKENIRLYDDNQMLNMIERVQHLEKQRHLLIGIVLVTMGVALQALSGTIGGTGFKDFISGIMLGLSVGEMLVGVFIAVRSYVK
jgi:transcriptional regulator with XRE-family HTH domain